jgi:hypothetical protein
MQKISISVLLLLLIGNLISCLEQLDSDEPISDSFSLSGYVYFDGKPQTGFLLCLIHLRLILLLQIVRVIFGLHHSYDSYMYNSAGKIAEIVISRYSNTRKTS